MPYLSILLLIGSVFVAGCDTRATPLKDAETPAANSPETAPSHTPANAAPPAAVVSVKAALEPDGRSAGAAGTQVPGTAHHTEPAAAPVSPSAAAIETHAREVTIPAGTTLTLRLGSTVSSKSSRVEDPVTATLRRAIVVDGVTVVPAGAVLSGHVIEATRSGRVKGRARIGVRFSNLRVGDTRYDIRTNPIARQARATKSEDTTRIGIGAGAGAVAGAIAGGRKGAAIGSAVGAAGGTGVVLATRGKEVSLGRGATVTTRLSEPLMIRVR